MLLFARSSAGGGTTTSEYGEAVRAQHTAFSTQHSTKLAVVCFSPLWLWANGARGPFSQEGKSTMADLCLCLSLSPWCLPQHPDRRCPP